MMDFPRPLSQVSIWATRVVLVIDALCRSSDETMTRRRRHDARDFGTSYRILVARWRRGDRLDTDGDRGGRPSRLI